MEKNYLQQLFEISSYFSTPPKSTSFLRNRERLRVPIRAIPPALKISRCFLLGARNKVATKYRQPHPHPYRRRIEAPCFASLPLWVPSSSVHLSCLGPPQSPPRGPSRSPPRVGHQGWYDTSVPRLPPWTTTSPAPAQCLKLASLAGAAIAHNTSLLTTHQSFTSHAHSSCIWTLLPCQTDSMESYAGGQYIYTTW
jgi:hypothetical protein